MTAQFRLVEINEAMCPARKYVGAPHTDRAAAEQAARDRMGDPARRRKFYAVAVEGPDGLHEVARGTK